MKGIFKKDFKGIAGGIRRNIAEAIPKSIAERTGRNFEQQSLQFLKQLIPNKKRLP